MLNLYKAIDLVKAKYEDETNGRTNEETAGAYASACERFPALMAVAHDH